MFSATEKRRKINTSVTATVVFVLILSMFMLASTGCGNNNYKTSVIQNWKALKEKADRLVGVLGEMKTVDDFEALQSIATETRDYAESLYEKGKDESVPAGFAELKNKELRALESIVEYLDTVVETADKTKVEQFKEEKDLIESRARKALSDVNDFIEESEFLDIAISADFFNAAAKMEDAIEYRGEGYEQQAEQALQTLKIFMKADIDELNADLLWELASSRRKEMIIFLGGSKEYMANYHAAQWGDVVPTSYYIDEHAVEISAEGVASIPVIVYAENEVPMDSHVELVLEPDGWKVHVYPWLGWLTE